MKTKLFVSAFFAILALAVSACGEIPTSTALQSVPFPVPGKITLVRASGAEVTISVTGMHIWNTFGLFPEDYFDYSVQPTNELKQNPKGTWGFCGYISNFGGKCTLVLKDVFENEVVLRLNEDGSTDLVYDPRVWTLK